MKFLNISSFILIATPLSAQPQMYLDLTLHLHPKTVQKQLNPVPLRDGIPQALLKWIPPPINPSLAHAQHKNVKPFGSSKLDTAQNTQTQSILNQELAIATASKQPVQRWVFETLQRPNGVEIRRFKTPAPIALPVFVKIPAPKKIKIFTAQTTPALQPVVPMSTPQLQPTNYVLTDLIAISTEEYKMIQALLLLELHQKYESAMSLFIDLMSSAQFKQPAQYYYAYIAQILGYKSEYRHYMLEVMKKSNDRDLQKKAVISLVEKTRFVNAEDIQDIQVKMRETGVTATHPDYFLREGQYFLSQGAVQQAVNSFNQVGNKAANLTEVRLLLSSAHYRSGDLSAALTTLESLPPLAIRQATDQIRNLYYLTMARLQFQKGQYKNSYQSYLKIDKNSAFWLQASVEQATTQIMAKDYVGAAGNMFSLHTDYFKKAYAPDSYVIRAAGYLNLCQFGDAVTVVAELQRKYTQLNEQIEQFSKLHTSHTDYYKLVRQLFENTDATEVGGLSRSFVIELARTPEFMSLQKKINNIEAEAANFKKMSQHFVNKSQSVKQEIFQLRALIEKNKKNKVVQLNESLENKILSLESEVSLLLNSRDKIDRMRILADQRHTADKEKIKARIASVLKARFEVAQKQLAEVMEQKDLLAYEIYSGAGEHLRYQMTGGQVPERAPAQALKPEDKQSYHWKFRGEVWEDEVGHYRSSLTDVCPQNSNDYAQSTGG